MLRAPVPKAPVYEHSKLRTDKDHIGPPSRPRQRVVNAVAEPESTQGGSEGNLSRRVSAPSELHTLANSC